MPPGTPHHLEIAVVDLPRALSFWEWFLAEVGYEPYEEWETGRSFLLGDFYIVIRKADAPDPQFEEGHAGLHHVAFHARSRAHVDAITDGVRVRGLPVLYEDRHPFAGGYYALYCRDPDGIKVELVAPDQPTS